MKCCDLVSATIRNSSRPVEKFHCDSQHPSPCVGLSLFLCVRFFVSQDGIELPPPIDFGIEESQSRLPRSQDHFFCSSEGQAFTKQFLEQFYIMYDNQSSRDALTVAYADHAQFSMSAYTATSAYVVEFFLQAFHTQTIFQTIDYDNL